MPGALDRAGRRVELAFGPRTERLDPGQVKPVPPPMGWEQEFIRGMNISPPGADEGAVE